VPRLETELLGQCAREVEIFPPSTTYIFPPLSRSRHVLDRNGRPRPRTDGHGCRATCGLLVAVDRRRPISRLGPIHPHQRSPVDGRPLPERPRYAWFVRRVLFARNARRVPAAHYRRRRDRSLIAPIIAANSLKTRSPGLVGVGISTACAVPVAKSSAAMLVLSVIAKFLLPFFVVHFAAELTVEPALIRPFVAVWVHLNSVS
jgi:hypothetical protein